MDGDAANGKSESRANLVFSNRIGRQRIVVLTVDSPKGEGADPDEAEANILDHFRPRRPRG